MRPPYRDQRPRLYLSTMTAELKQAVHKKDFTWGVRSIS